MMDVNFNAVTVEVIKNLLYVRKYYSIIKLPAVDCYSHVVDGRKSSFAMEITLKIEVVHQRIITFPGIINIAAMVKCSLYSVFVP